MTTRLGHDHLGKRILLIAGVPPCTNYSGGILLEAVVRAASIEPVAIIAVQDLALHPKVPADLLVRIPITTLDKPPERYEKDVWSDDTDRIRAAEQAVLRERIPALERAVDRAIEKYRITDIWIVLEGQSLIRLAARLLDRGDVKVRPQVTDPPGWWLREARVDPETRREVLGDFEATLRRAPVVACASPAMADRYADQYGANTVPIVHALPRQLQQPAGCCDISGPARIGFAGQAYARDEIAAFLEAVESLNGGGRFGRVEVHMTIVNSPLPDAGHCSTVVFRQQTDQRSLVRRLSRMHLLYCPYWFDSLYREESDLCFPSKLVPYLASGRPILFHGRRDAYPAKFLVESEAAFFSFSPDPIALESAIARAFSDVGERERIGMAGSRVFTEHFEYRSLKRAFVRFLEA